jgi:uncharacterized protein YdeI (YjbR/CyaY-like superfamily)
MDHDCPMADSSRSTGPAERPRVHMVDRETWRIWLSAHAAASKGIWLVYDKGPQRRLTYEDIVEEALCVGWVDGQARRLDEHQAMLLLAPRRPMSAWSRVNKQRVERLTAAGRMSPSGLAAVEIARHNGRWNALDAVEDLTEPDDLRAALNGHSAARAHWDEFPRSAKRAILEWISAARKPQTRAARVAETVGEAAQGRRAHQWRR